MGEPRTEAGSDLMTHLRREKHVQDVLPAVYQSVLAIEAEAVADFAARVRARVLAEPGYTWDGKPAGDHFHRSMILAILDEEATRSGGTGE